MISAGDIQARIEQGLPEADVAVTDPMQDGTHLQALVVSNAFEGQRMLKRHRMVYAALGDSFETDLHALQLQTLTPAEYELRLEQEKETEV